MFKNRTVIIVGIKMYVSFNLIRVSEKFLHLKLSF